MHHPPPSLPRPPCWWWGVGARRSPWRCRAPAPLLAGAACCPLVRGWLGGAPVAVVLPRARPPCWLLVRAACCPLLATMIIHCCFRLLLAPRRPWSLARSLCPHPPHHRPPRPPASLSMLPARRGASSSALAARAPQQGGRLGRPPGDCSPSHPRPHTPHRRPPRPPWPGHHARTTEGEGESERGS